MNNYKNILKRDISMKENKLMRLNKKQNEQLTILDVIDHETQEKTYFTEIKKLENIQEQMELTQFELDELRDELGELE